MRKPLYQSRPVAPKPATLRGERINDFIVLVEAFSNCYRIETQAGALQINAGMGLEAPIIEAAFAQHSDQPVQVLIATQGHVDHLGGVQYFRENQPGLRFIATAGNAEHQAYDARLAPFRAQRSAFAFADKFATALADYSEHGITEFPAQDQPTPDQVVEERLSLDVGGLAIELIALPGAETNDSLIVWLPEQRICFTGNLFGCPFGHFPNLVTIRGDRYRDPLVVAAAVRTVRDLEPEMILYGHHGPIAGSQLIQDELQALHAAIMHVHDATVAGMNQGKDVHTLMQEIDLPAEMEVGQGYGKVSWGVRAIWESYAGWFHHRSTTELYSVPVAAIASDLLELAGGTGALLERARQRYAEGRHEEALHLLDIIRDAGGDTDASRQLGLDIHRDLEMRSDNFWLSAWLRQQQLKLASGMGEQ